uniref:insulin-like growth factor-binding protein 5 isoform X1 n=1 Tax=Myxine glutinosa TaxID=7769 RepID=UPI00358FD79C
MLRQRSLFFVLCAAATWRSSALAQPLGSVFRCAPCDADALARCPETPERAPGCPLLVREPGCGCCLVCALGDGDPCGAYTESCGPGLKCTPRLGEPRPLRALLAARGVCRSTRTYRLYIDTFQQSSDVETRGGVLGRADAVSPSTRSSGADCRLDRPTWAAQDSDKEQTRRAKMRKRVQHASSDKSSSDRDSDNSASQPGPEPKTSDNDYGPCRHELESVLRDLNKGGVVYVKDFYLPNCDKKGFYKRKQCQSAKGRKKGLCWLVDRYGNSIAPSQAPCPSSGTD